MGLLTDNDRRQLLKRGMLETDVAAQLALFAAPPAPTALVRACSIGDGIVQLDASRHDALLARWQAATDHGRLGKFVPASGAASRMFQLIAPLSEPGATSELVDLAQLDRRAAAGERAAASIAQLVRGLPDLALWREVETTAPELAARHRAAPTPEVNLAILRLLLDEHGLDLPRRPKALLPFHRAGEGVRTAFDEHLAEAVQTVRDRDGVCRLHFTISPAHLPAFEAARRRAAAFARDLGATFDVSFSVQEPHTDTISVDPEGRPFRQADGQLLFRPGGHGALLYNLELLAGDVVYIKNVDNVVPDATRAETTLWKRLLAGVLLEIEADARALVRRLRAGAEEATSSAMAMCAGSLGVTPPAGLAPEATRQWALERLDRPLRVCGVVRNTSEPGGGPFWVRLPDGTVSRQIVESAQVDAADPEQRACFAGASHFNPVDLVCSMRDPDGRPYPLASFVDPSAVFLARRSHEGRELVALERPGLWNGAMARWNTVFVEVPGETFTPVKSVLDLLRAQHRAP